MNGWRPKTYLVRLYFATLGLFAANKLVLRPLVSAADAPQLLEIFVGSLPNTCEAIVGTANVAGLLTWARLAASPRFDRVTHRAVCTVAVVLSGVYVITQELGLHALGGRNVYDPYDVVASLVGLTGMLVVLERFGVLEHEARGPDEPGRA